MAKLVINSSFMASVTIPTAVWILMLGTQNLLAETFRGYRNIRYVMVFGGVVTTVCLLMLLATVYFQGGAVSLQGVMTLNFFAYGISIFAGGVFLRGKRCL